VFDIIGKRNWFFLFSALITIPGLIFIFLTPLTGGGAGLKFSIDYTGGTLWEVRFAQAQPPAAGVKDILVQQGLSDSTVTLAGDGFVLIRTVPIGLRVGEAAPTSAPTVAPSAAVSPAGSPAPSAAASVASPAAGTSPGASAPSSPSATPAPTASPTASPTPKPSGGFTVPTEGKLGDVATALQAKYGPIAEVRQQTTIGPIISGELTQQAIILVILGSIGILLWISFRFRDVKFGVSAIVALIHDVIVVVGTFAVLGTVIGLQVDALFVTAMLTVIGFSVHDTIVVFDRIRENRHRHAGEPFAAIANHSILQTIGRSINTSMTVIITLIALLLFGASSVQGFIFALLIGIITGTYSSVFNATPVLVVWHEWEERRRQRAVTLARASR
jgi:preprotein translocase SecF subunit